MDDLHQVNVLRELFDFFALPCPQRWRLVGASRMGVNRKRSMKRSVMAKKADALPPYGQWPARNQARLSELCGEMAVALGYVV